MSSREYSKRSSDGHVLAQPVSIAIHTIVRIGAASCMLFVVGCRASHGPEHESDRASSTIVPQTSSTPKPPAPAPWSLPVPGSTESIAFVPVPAGKITASIGGVAREIEVAELYMSRCEITWDHYDAFVFARDREQSEAADPPDAFARPSKPYITMDRGYGHTGYPVISVSYQGAREFCRWLSWRTGRKIRLPTEAEFEHACRADAASTSAAASKTNASVVAASTLDDVAWYRGNAGDKTHPVGTKQANAFGLCDMLGNAREWCVGFDGKPVTLGGSYRSDKAAFEGIDRLVPSASWNRSDPQIPKSVWWLADGGFVGFRVVCE